MTPEQETYKEYGRAQEALHQTIKEIKKRILFYFWEAILQAYEVGKGEYIPCFGFMR